MIEPMLTPRQLVEQTGGSIPLDTVYYHLRRGKIAGRKFFGRWLIPLKEAERVVGTRTGGAGPTKGRPRPERPGRRSGSYRYFDPPA
jgi:hypothetical protein